jgi:hypothetical protein
MNGANVTGRIYEAARLQQLARSTRLEAALLQEAAEEAQKKEDRKRYRQGIRVVPRPLVQPGMPVVPVMVMDEVELLLEA